MQECVTLGCTFPLLPKSTNRIQSPDATASAGGQTAFLWTELVIAVFTRGADPVNCGLHTLAGWQ